MALDTVSHPTLAGKQTKDRRCQGTGRWPERWLTRQAVSAAQSPAGAPALVVCPGSVPGVRLLNPEVPRQRVPPARLRRMQSRGGCSRGSRCPGQGLARPEEGQAGTSPRSHGERQSPAPGRNNPAGAEPGAGRGRAAPQRRTLGVPVGTQFCKATPGTLSGVSPSSSFSIYCVVYSKLCPLSTLSVLKAGKKN